MKDRRGKLDDFYDKFKPKEKTLPKAALQYEDTLLSWLNSEKERVGDTSAVVATSPKIPGLNVSAFENPVPTVWTETHVYVKSDQHPGYETPGLFTGAPRNP